MTEIFRYISHYSTLDKLENMVDEMKCHPDSLETKNKNFPYVAHEGNSLLYEIIIKFSELTARHTPPTRPQGLRIIEKLLKKGADPNKFRRPKSGSGTFGIETCPMYQAINRNHNDIAELFFKYGGKADIDGTNELLHCASGYNHHGIPNYKMCLLLLNNGGSTKTLVRGKITILQDFEKHYPNELKYPQSYKRYQENIQNIHKLFKNPDGTLAAEKRKIAEAERQRQAAEAERQRQAAEAERQRQEAEAERQRQAAETERQRIKWINSEEYKRQAAEVERKKQEAEAERQRQEAEAKKQADIKRREEHKAEGSSYIVWALHHIEFLNKYSNFIGEEERERIEKETKYYFELARENMPEQLFNDIVSGLSEEYMKKLT